MHGDHLINVEVRFNDAAVLHDDGHSSTGGPNEAGAGGERRLREVF